LRQRRLEARVVGDENRAARLLGERADARPRDDAGGVAVERARAGEDAERRLGQRVLVVLEEDEELQSSRLSTRKSMIVAAVSAPPSMRRLSPRGGGGWSASTDVALAASAPSAAASSVSCGFDFAPMIPLSDG
jgi:hypothetical protein